MSKLNFNLRSKNIFLFLYFSLMSFTVLLRINFFHIINTCSIYEYYYYSNISFFEKLAPELTLIVLGILYSYFFKPKFKFLYSGIYPLMVFIITFSLLDRKKGDIFLKETCVITKGVIYKTFSTQYRFNIQVSSTVINNYVYNSSFDVNRKHGNCPNRIQIGDTVLLMYSKECPAIIDLYKVCPTKSELEKCKNDCYLIHGKLIPVDEVDEKDLWKY